MNNSKASRIFQITIGALSLLCLLVYTWTHTGALLSEYVDPEFVGYIAALGIELSIVGLSLRIGDLKRSGLDSGFFVATLIAVVAVSAMANIAMGYAVKFGEPLTLGSIFSLDIVQAAVSLAATGLISLVTFALAELVGQDVSAAVKLNTKPKPVTTTVKSGTVEVTGDVQTVPVVQATPVTEPVILGDTEPVTESVTVTDDRKPDSKADSMSRLLEYATVNKGASISELSRHIGVSRTTVYNYLDELEKAGRLHRNGQIEVLDKAG